MKKYCVIIYGEIERECGLDIDEAEAIADHEYRVNQRTTRIEEDDSEECEE